MSHHEPRPTFGAIHDAGAIIPALTLGEYRRRTSNATRPLTDPPIGARRKPGVPFWLGAE